MSALRTSKYVHAARGRFAGDNEVPILPRMMVFSTLGLVALGVALSVFAGPLFALADQGAKDMMRRTPYIEAVLGQGATR